MVYSVRLHNIEKCSQKLIFVLYPSHLRQIIGYAVREMQIHDLATFPFLPNVKLSRSPSLLMESTSSSSTGVTMWDGNLCTSKYHLLTVTDSGFFLGQHPGFQSVCYLETGWLHVCFYVFRIPSHWQSYNSTGRKSTWEEEHLVHVVFTEARDIFGDRLDACLLLCPFEVPHIGSLIKAPVAKVLGRRNISSCMSFY